MYTFCVLFLMQPNETCGQLDPMESLNNPASGIFIISEWSTTGIDETPQDTETDRDSDGEQYKQNSPLLFSSPEPVPDEESDAMLPIQQHTIAFKVMGTVKLSGVQQILQKVRDCMLSGIATPVRVIPEPTNPIDKNAIAFQCYLDSTCMAHFWLCC